MIREERAKRERGVGCVSRIGILDSYRYKE